MVAKTLTTLTNTEFIEISFTCMSEYCTSEPLRSKTVFDFPYFGLICQVLPRAHLDHTVEAQDCFKRNVWLSHV